MMNYLQLESLTFAVHRSKNTFTTTTLFQSIFISSSAETLTYLLSHGKLQKGLLNVLYFCSFVFNQPCKLVENEIQLRDHLRQIDYYLNDNYNAK